MRIAFLTPEYPTLVRPDGGLANYIRKAAAALTHRGCEATVFVASDREAEWEDGIVRVREVAHPAATGLLSRIPYGRGFVPFLQQVDVSRRLAAAFWSDHGRKPFHIAHTSNYLACGSALLRNGKVPVVCRVSSYNPLLRAATGIQRGFPEYLRDRMEARQVTGADSVFSPSAFMARVYGRFEGVEPRVISTPLEEDLPASDRSAYEEVRPARPYLLYFGTLNRIKGADLLVETVPELLTRNPNLGFVLVGRDDGLPDGQRIAPILLSRSGTCSERILWIPALPKARLLPFIEDAEAVVMPSRVDNYPNACLEAQVFGKPVIGTLASSLEEMIIEGETGYLADNGDAGSLLAAVERFLALGPSAREAMRNGIWAHIDAVRKEDRIGRLIDFYRETIDRFHLPMSA